VAALRAWGPHRTPQPPAARLFRAAGVDDDGTSDVHIPDHLRVELVYQLVAFDAFEDLAYKGIAGPQYVDPAQLGPLSGFQPRGQLRYQGAPRAIEVALHPGRGEEDVPTHHEALPPDQREQARFPPLTLQPVLEGDELEDEGIYRTRRSVVAAASMDRAFRPSVLPAGLYLISGFQVSTSFHSLR